MYEENFYHLDEGSAIHSLININAGAKHHTYGGQGLMKEIQDMKKLGNKKYVQGAKDTIKEFKAGIGKKIKDLGKWKYIHDLGLKK